MKIYALANELNLDRSNVGTITIPFGTWDYGEKKVESQGGGGERTLFFRQTLDLQGASAIAAQIADSIAKGEKGVPVYWGHPDVPELAHKYPDKRAKGWITSASVEDGKLVLSVDWLEDKATDGFGWFSPFWTGPVKENGDGTALMHVDSLTSVALINMPNIQEFRLANELQDTNNAAQAEKGNTMNITKEELCKLLGLPPEATDEQIRTALTEAGKAKEALATEKTKLEAAEADKAAAVNECEKVKTELANEKAAHRGILLDNAIADGRISVAGRAAWEKRLTDDFKAGSIALANEKPMKRESAVAGRQPQKSCDLNLVALANERLAKNPGMTYTTAFALVMKEHPEVK